MRRKQPITPENDPIARGQRLRQARQFAGITARKLSEMLNYSSGNLSCHESGKRPLRNEQLMQRICEITGVNLPWLKSGIGHPVNDPDLHRTFDQKAGITVKTVLQPLNEAVFLAIYEELKKLTEGVAMLEVELVKLTAKTYTILIASSICEEDLVRLVPSAARLALQFKHEYVTVTSST